MVTTRVTAPRWGAPIVTLVTALGLVRLVHDELIRNGVRVALRRLRAGDPEPALRLLAPDVRFRFPGTGSRAVDTHGRDEVRRWLRQFVDNGLLVDVEDILVSGPPWATLVCVRFTEHSTDHTGRLVYLNHGVILAEVSWSRAVRCEAVVDTEKLSRLDDYLAGRTTPTR